MTRNQTARRGFTLVELLVAMVIGLVLTLALTTIMIRHDSGKRTLTSTNDLSLASAYASLALDRELRSAGSGFTQDWQHTFGCPLHAARGGTQILPRTAAFPAPFASVPQTVRLAPVLIHAGAGTGGSDVLAIATGAAGLGESPAGLLDTATSSDLRIRSTVGLRGNDLVLVAADGSGCMLQQVAAPFTGGASQLLAFGGTYASGQIAALQLTDFGADAFVSPLGNTTGNRPAFQLIGIGPNATLVRHDMLRLDGTDAVQPMVDGIADLRALYGVDSDNDGLIDSWVSPTDANFTAASLSAGTQTANERLLSILAVRVGLVLRSDHIERDEVAPTSVALFTDLAASLQYTHNIAAGLRYQRHRTVEFTVPLRNVMITERSPVTP